jgi:hypothetical protein
LSLFAATSFAKEPAAEEAISEKDIIQSLKLPGIEIKPEEGVVDVSSQICLTEGFLELIACTEGTKEHEAIVKIKAKPVHVHTALLLIGARNGTPAMRKPVNEEQTRWVHYRPSGDPIAVSLVYKDAEGNEVERPINDFLRKNEGDPYMPDYGNDTEKKDDKPEEKFPDVFLFTGSHLVDGQNGERQYLADSSGHVITISTFGDELLGLADFHSRENGELVWEVDPTHIPPLDSEVTLRLRPKRGATE